MEAAGNAHEAAKRRGSGRCWTGDYVYLEWLSFDGFIQDSQLVRKFVPYIDFYGSYG